MLNAFIITGPEPKRLIVRGLGPSLVLPMRLADPVIELRASDGTLIAINDNWRDTQEAEIIATGLAPGNDLESAIVATLSPGSYTVVLRGVGGGTGSANCELYDLAPSSAHGVTAAGTRANVLLNGQQMIASIIMQRNGTVLLRALGPSLAEVGVSGALADPTVELRDGNGAVLQSNDDWMDAPNRQEIIDSTLAPSNPLESAILMTLPANNSTYIAIASGVNGATGIGYVQFYDLPHSGPGLKLTP
jgi:hypothetical protein